MNKEFDVYNQKRGVKLQIGDEFKTLDGCDVKVIEVLNAGSCVIQCIVRQMMSILNREHERN